ncbi:Synerg-CTERM sorting domain-containing protein [Cloacibacillus evryensis]|uniref:Synerg-CTERM sorting domain-containing protein n=1 Tax=Cloacibacillus evryensis TaxID=508460 RepID=UPI003AB7D5E7
MRIKKATTRLFALFLALLVLALPASADILFTRQASYSDPVSLGIISGSSAPFSPLQSNMGGNTGNRVLPFLDAKGNLRIALTFYTGTSSVAADTIDIYNPGAKVNWAKPANWNTPLKEFTCSTKNVRALATIGSYLYTTGYDKAVISRVVMTDDAYVENKVWTYPTPSGKNFLSYHGEGLFTYAGHLYAIITDADDPFNPKVQYGRNQIWKFDKDLNVIASADMTGYNMDGQQGGIYTRVGNKLYVCSFGGYQVEDGTGYNNNTTVEVCNLDTLKSTRLLRGEETEAKFPEWHYMFSGIALLNGKVYLHGTTWTAPGGQKGSHEMVVYETTETKLASGDIGTRIGSFVGDYGVQMGFTYDPTTGYLWAREGDSIQRYEGGVSWTKFSKDDLKGSLTDAAPITVGSTGGSGAVIPTIIPVEATDISVDGGSAAKVTTNADTPSALAQAVSDGDYSSFIEGGSNYGSVLPLSSIVVNLEHDASSSAAFTIKNFDYTPKSNGSICVLLRKKAGLGSKYDVFPATLENGVLKFAISPLGYYFSENTIVIAETTAVETPEPDKPWAGDGASTSGCDAGFAALALLALIPLGLRRKR